MNTFKSGDKVICVSQLGSYAEKPQIGVTYEVKSIPQIGQNELNSGAWFVTIQDGKDIFFQESDFHLMKVLTPYKETVITPTNQQLMGEPVAPAMPDPVQSFAVMSKLQDEVRTQTRKAVDDSYAYSRAMLQDFTENTMREIHKKLGTIQKPAPMEIKINGGQTITLTKRVSPVLEDLIKHAQLGINSLLVGPAGCGKSTVAEQLAEALQVAFSHTCFTAGMSETWLFGRQTPNGFIEGGFSSAYRNGGVFNGDEVDAADSNTMLCINTALSADHMYNPISGEMIKKHPKFVFIGCANTTGRGGDEVYTARTRLDGSTLDRFVAVTMTYDRDIETDLCPDEGLREKLWAMREHIEEAKSKEIISTRCLDRSYRMKQAGIPVDTILDRVTFGWPAELKEKAIPAGKRKYTKKHSEETMGF